MNKILLVELVCLTLFVSMFLTAVVFQKLGRRWLNEAHTAPEISDIIAGAVFALLGLLIAFTFSGAHTRLDTRRQLIVQEVNAMGTAYLRLDVLPPAAQQAVRERFRAYVASRAALYDKLGDAQAARVELARSGALQKQIWDQAIAASSEPQYQPGRILLLPALNDMFDVVTVRAVAIQTHPPMLIWTILFAIALACSGLTGYRSAIHERPAYAYYFLLAAVIVSVLYVTLDIEYPRYGFVNMDKVNQVLLDFEQSIK